MAKVALWECFKIAVVHGIIVFICDEKFLCNLNTWPGKNHLVSAADHSETGRRSLENWLQIGCRSLKNHWGKSLIGRRSLAMALAMASTTASTTASATASAMASTTASATASAMASTTASA